MKQFTSPVPAWGHIVSVDRSDRWSIHRRLQELGIPCACPADGTLRVEVNHAIALVLLHSAVRQCLASRQEAMDWLERCWYTQVSCLTDH